MATERTPDDVLAEIGPRLKRARERRQVTLVQLSAETGISKSTLSRLESGQRKPSLELLLPIAHAHRIPLDELIGAPEIGDPRIRPRPQKRRDRIVVPLTTDPHAAHAWKVVIPPERGERRLRSHAGREWIYVLAGELRLILGGRDLTMSAGEVVEFDTEVPHWFGAAGHRPVEILSILRRDGDPIGSARHDRAGA